MTGSAAGSSTGSPAEDAPDPGDPADPAELALAPAPGGAGRRRGLPGGRVVTVGTLVVIAAAVVEALVLDRIGAWTGGTLIVVGVIAASVTRAGDRSLPAMMPPLAFVTAALVGGQLLLTTGNEAWWARQAAMLLDVLGSNAVLVVVATALAVVIALVRHLVDRARGRR